MLLSTEHSRRVRSMLGTIFVILVVVFPVIAAAQENQGMAVWANHQPSTPTYAFWNDGSFSAPKTMQNTGNKWVVIQGAYSPTRDEAIVVGVGEDMRVTAQMYDGEKWTELPFSPLTEEAKDLDISGFDVQYESNSGKAVLVWHQGGGSDNVLYRTWDGSSWSPESIVDTPADAGKHKDLHLETNPNSNEMIMAVQIRQGSGYCAVWDGETWGNGIQTYQNRIMERSKNIDVAYEQKSGRAIVAYGEPSSPRLEYRIWDGSNWNAARTLSPPASVWGNSGRVRISADPSSNRMVVQIREYSLFGSIWLGIWDGDEWVSVVVATTATTPLRFFDFGVAFEGTSGKALAVYSKVNTKTVVYRIWSEQWSEERTGPTFDSQVISMYVSTSPRGNEVMLSVRDIGVSRFGGGNGDESGYFCAWDGVSWGPTFKVASTSETHAQSFKFFWKPQRLIIGVPPTPIPTPFPSSHPTLRPTSEPSSKPTTKPTQEPTPIPTPVPSLHPTKNPTETPTTMPTTRPTTTPTVATVTPSPTPLPTSGQKVATTEPAPTKPSRPTPAPFSSNGLEETTTGSPDAGKVCNKSSECKSATCRNGVCMATPDCYPVKHKFGTPFDKHKINLVFVASSFDSESHEAWRAQVNTTCERFGTFNMFSQDIDQLNVFLVDPEVLDPAFCKFGCQGVDRLLCCNIRKAHMLSRKCFSAGENLQTVVIHNSPKYGGAGYTSANLATVTTHSLASLVAVHELGHSLFHFADEYWYGDGTEKDANCDSSGTCEKWLDLVDDTPDGYDPVQCIPGCSLQNFYIGAMSFMGKLDLPVGAVNERFTCCTYQALTKTMPLYCNAFDTSPGGYLFNYCKTNDYQKYGASNYYVSKKAFEALEENLELTDEHSEYIYVSDPVLLTISPRVKSNGNRMVFRSIQTPLSPGIFPRSQVEGDFRKAKKAARKGVDSVIKVVIKYQKEKKVRKGKETFFFSPAITIDVPLPLNDAAHHDREPRVVTAKSNEIEVVLDTKGRSILSVRSSMVNLKAKS